MAASVFNMRCGPSPIRDKDYPAGWFGVVVQDRFGGGYSDRLDLFKETEDECRKFGRQILRCKIETP